MARNRTTLDRKANRTSLSCLPDGLATATMTKKYGGEHVMFIAYGGVFLRTSPHHAFSTVQNGRGQGQPCAAGAATSGPPLGSPPSALASLGWFSICLSTSASISQAREIHVLHVDCGYAGCHQRLEKGPCEQAGKVDGGLSAPAGAVCIFLLDRGLDSEGVTATG